MLQFPRDWFGPQEELVPIGPQAETEAPANGAGPAPVALDFWGGETALEDLVPFPATSGARPETSERTPPEARRRHGRPLSIRRPSGRRVAVAMALLFCGVIAIRALGAQSPGTANAGRSDVFAGAGSAGRAVTSGGRELDFRDEPRVLGVRRLAIIHSPRPAARIRHIAIHRHVTGTPQGPPAASGQPVVYSPPVASQ